MKQTIRLIAIILFSVVTTAAATAALTAPAEPRTRIDTDEKTGAIIFVVNGKEQARITGAGLHVRRGVDYGGTITDEGEASYDVRSRRAE